MKIANRLQRLRQKLAEIEIDAIFISQPENRRYLSGFDGSAGYLCITEKDAVIATDFRYLEQVKQQSPDYKIFQITGGMENWLPELVAGVGSQKLGFESQSTSFAMYRQMGNVMKKSGSSHPRLVPLEGLVESLRAVKDAEEIEAIAKAAAISDNAFQYIEENIRAGISEKDIEIMTKKNPAKLLGLE